MTDHYAVSDEHALSIARNIVANLNWTEGTKTFVSFLKLSLLVFGHIPVFLTVATRFL